MADGSMLQVQLKRQENSQPWGFRLRGGTDQGIPLHVEQVAPNGRAGHAGLRQGDYVVAIGGNRMDQSTHALVKQEILRSGNEIDFVIHRPAGGAAAAPPPPGPGQQEAPRVQVIEEPTCKLGGPTYKQVTQKTMQILESELPQAEADGGRPASIFERRRQERSGYLNAKGKTIQKAYGEG